MPSIPSLAANRAIFSLPDWMLTLRFQMAFALGLLFLLLAMSVGFTLYELSLRRHDYQILNLAGQLRVSATTMHQQARNYLRDAPTDPETYRRDLGLFYADLKQHVALFDTIIASFKSRRLDPSLTGRDDHLTCNWDTAARRQLDLTADDWRIFRAGLMEGLGQDADGPRLEYAAAYIAEHGAYLSGSTMKLARGFQTMMEGKLSWIEFYNKLVLGVAAVIMLVLLGFLYWHLVSPLRRTIAGFERVARGDLGYQVPVRGGNEIGQMTRAFNQLSERLNALFRLTDRIHQGNNLTDTLRTVFEEFRGFIPLDWVGLLMPAPDGRRLVLDRQHGGHHDALSDGSAFSLNDPDLDKALADGAAVHLARLAEHCERSPASHFAVTLEQAGFGSVILLRASAGDHKQGAAVLAFASRKSSAYSLEHTELLENVAVQLAHALDKTVFLERLVVAAVQGLAKLAESRDPETGDHLVRMALYAAFITEELGREGPYRERIDAAFIRDIHQFAPMHDIGKVGIADSILLKPGRLDDAERAEMQRHPVIGGEVLRRCEAQVNDLGHRIFQHAVEIAEAHHERFDGSGYPAGLAGEGIPLSARIVAVADVFDALTSKRPYKAAWSVDTALEVMAADAGGHFDPEVLAGLRRAMPRVMDVHDRLKHV